MSTWWDYVVRTAKTDVQKTIAVHTGISETAFSRWKKGTNKPEAPHVIAFARAYDRPAVEALIAADILLEHDAKEVVEIYRDIAELTNEQLLREVRDRMKPWAPPVSTFSDSSKNKQNSASL